MSNVSYVEGLTRIADDVWAYLQPDGSWGYSNAGLVGGDGTSVLVDTLFDLHLTGRMLAAMEPHVTKAPIGTVVNTHANGDHCYGNQLVTGARFVTSAASADEMTEVPATALLAMKDRDLGADANAFIREAFGPFDFEGIEVPPPDETFSGSTSVDAGGRSVVLEEVGPAHTGGDIIAWVPDAGVVFTGDILFIGGTPIVWSGPIANWLAALGRIRALDPGVVVPGHGPLTGLDGVAAVAGYFEWLLAESGDRQAKGMTALEAAWDLDLGPYQAWSDRERTIVNVDAAYAEVDPGHQRMDMITVMSEMGRYRFRME